MSKIKMYWWKETSNFGDGLNPYLIKKISGHIVEWSALEKADLVGAGSLLQWITKIEDKLVAPLHVWGSGYMYDEEPRTSSSLIKYHAVRGYKSKQYGGLEGVVFGDPGILADLLLEDCPSYKHSIGIVPHLWHLDDSNLASLLEQSPQLKLIDVRLDPLDVIKQIAECEFIFASSLHGLIVADSLGIANRWVHFNKPLFGGDWKFEDYYSVFGITPKPVQLSSDTHLETLMIETRRNYSRPGLAKLRRDLIDAFPAI
jgi:pyruvyltransferase